MYRCLYFVRAGHDRYTLEGNLETEGEHDIRVHIFKNAISSYKYHDIMFTHLKMDILMMENNETILVKTQENSYQAIAKMLTQLQYTEKHRIGLGEEEASLLMPFPKRATNGRRADVEEIEL
ncbi:hypothetical protein ACJX0J_035739 [Zea mays]